MTGYRSTSWGRFTASARSKGSRDRGSVVRIGGAELLVASLDDVIKSKRAAGRPRDLAVLELLEKAREEAAE
jgi:hypothetical protein